MKKAEVIKRLEELGFKTKVEGTNELCAYFQLRYFLQSNRETLKNITALYLVKNELHANVSSGDVECGYSLRDEY